MLIGEPLGDGELTPLDHFLTARWALGSKLGGRLLWAPVDHAPWPLSTAEVIEWDETLIAAAGLPAPHGAPIARWSPGVEVRIGRPSLIQRRPRGR